jgi:hypothetical protein
VDKRRGRSNISKGAVNYSMSPAGKKRDTHATLACSRWDWIKVASESCPGLPIFRLLGIPGCLNTIEILDDVSDGVLQEYVIYLDRFRLLRSLGRRTGVTRESTYGVYIRG